MNLVGFRRYKNIFFYKSNSVASMLLIVFSCAFITKLVPLSPIYLTTMASLFLLTYAAKGIVTLRNRRVVYFFVLLFSIYLMLNLLLTNTGVIKDTKDLYVLIFFTQYFVFVDISLSKLKHVDFKKVLLFYFVFNLLFLFFELYMRIKAGMEADIPTWILANPNYIFYLFKENSIIFLDSNATATIVLSIIAIITYLWRDVSKMFPVLSKVFLVLYTVLLLGTFSRAAIAGYLVLVLYLILVYKRSVIIKFIMSILLFLLSVYTVIALLSDFSFLSKFQIFSETYFYLKSLDLITFLFGTGINSSSEHLSYYAHNVISIYLIEFGFVGFILFIIMFVVIAKSTSKNHFYMTIPYFIAALSFTPIIIPYVFCTYSLLYHIKRAERLTS